MHILIATLHVRASDQAVSLAAGCLKSSLPPEVQQQTELIDLFPEKDARTTCNQLLELNPTIIAFPLYVWNRNRILHISKLLRKEKSGLIMIAGGPEASADSHNVLNEGALDGVIRGEGEVSFAQLIHKLEKGAVIDDVAGYLSAAQSGQCAPTPTVCPDLSVLASPWLSGQLPLEKNCGVLWEVARGCQFNCAFCYDAKGHQGVRPFPVDRLKKELHLFTQRQVSQVWVLDSTFNAPPGRGKQLLQLLIEQAPQIHFHIEAKVDLLDSETIDLLSQLNCSVQIGLQSATPQVLNPLHRNLSPQQMERRLKQMSIAGITYGLDLIYGLPGDNHCGFKKSLDFALRQQPNQIDIFPLAVLPGTELFDHQQEFGIQSERRPPYLLQSNATYSQQDLRKSSVLAAATDIFYNRGRAVGFFLPLCKTLKSSPSAFLQQFSLWLNNHKHIKEQKLLDTESWYPEEILPLQHQYVAEQLDDNKLAKLQNLVTDLINYHFFCAETLLANDCLPNKDIPSKKNWNKVLWKLNPDVRIQSFHFTPEDLERVAGEPLEKANKQLSPDPGVAIFLRQQGEIFIESLDDSFAQILNRAKVKSTIQHLRGKIDGQLADELLDFAITQGLLQPIGSIKK
ncbi:B12-binding domain-containing radical SAM protein [uncultured Desulfuromusa sp.]|uniref:B12-binding domain-containing radical SAM protein n=1 Tax=uncultured Desulfuromusa sp. TaxID=219183 RepID=UPI002AA914A3|nr:radical SAM protein [uncultured Desulfuromusa sp.]